MQYNTQVLKEILLKENYVSAEDIQKAEEEVKHTHNSLIDFLLSHEIISKDLLGQSIAEYYKISYVNLQIHSPASEVVLLLPEAVARKYHAVVYEVTADGLGIVTDHPENTAMLPDIQRYFVGKKLHLSFALTEDIDIFFSYYKKPLETRFSEIIQKQHKVAPEIIGEIIKDALDFHASDIHFEPIEQVVIVRFRVDGILREAGKIPVEFYTNILNRIKVQAGLRIDEHFAAQDGAIRFHQDTTIVDMRVSVVPTVNGEKIAIRLLSEYVKGFTFPELGLNKKEQLLVEEAAKKPFGMILVTGPTGSGKTTTLYGLLKILNNMEVNITTIEDPVEYKIAGVNQIQVNVDTHLTFSEGLRSIVRQDPDVILVGEIRDLETAEIAVNAALTGHLLLSTFHANDAATAIPRLLDMGVEPFLLASTLQIIIAQRLIRKICDSCRYSYAINIVDLKKTVPAISASGYFTQKSVTLYKGKGCKTCNGSGYKGRVALFEIIEITQDMQDLILKNPSTNTIWALARQQGSSFLFEDGMDKVKSGTTTIEEVLRVAPPQRYYTKASKSQRVTES